MESRIERGIFAGLLNIRVYEGFFFERNMEHHACMVRRSFDRGAKDFIRLLEEFCDIQYN